MNNATVKFLLGTVRDIIIIDEKIGMLLNRCLHIKKIPTGICLKLIGLCNWLIKPFCRKIYC